MSRSLFINFRGNGFWAYDVPAAAFCKFLIDAANERLATHMDSWIADAVDKWRVSSAIPDLSWYADDEWSQSQIDVVVALSQIAIDRIRHEGDIPASEIESSTILADTRATTCGHDLVPCEPVARLGEAFIALLKNELPEPPERHWWFFTLEETTNTIAMRDDG